MTAHLIALIKKWRALADKAEKHIWIGGDAQIENETQMRDMRMCADDLEAVLLLPHGGATDWNRIDAVTGLPKKAEHVCKPSCHNPCLLDD